MQKSPARRTRSLITASLFACLALPLSVAAQQPPPDAVADAAVLEVPDSPARAHLWRSAGVQSWYVVSEDGITFSRPRRPDGRLYLRFGTFDPLSDGLAIDDSLRAAATGRLHIVQYHTQGLEAYRTTIRRLGGDVLLYMPRHANVVEMSADTAAVVATLPFVRSVTPYHPAFRLERELRDAIRTALPGQVKVNVLTTRRGPVAQGPVGDWVRGAGGTVDHVSRETFLMTVTLPVARLAQLAARDEVQWIDRWTPVETEGDMDIARVFHGANHVESQVNALGQGVRIEVLDGGCDTNHPDMQNFILHTTNTASSHGTACAGIVLGSGANNFSARGAMPQATLIIGDYSYLAGGSRYAHSAQLVDPSRNYRCVAQSNSWGNTRTRSYTSISQDMDTILFDLQNLSITQSQSNAGNQDSRPQAWAKNIIAVGGIRHRNTTTKSDDAWSGGASIGPAADGRIKPDLASFYDSILCCDRPGSSGYASGNYTSSFGGTSGATPIVAGMLGLFYQLWHQGSFGNPTSGSVFDSAPKNTTAKAFLIATATQWGFSGSNADLARMKQGWGHPDLQKMLDNSGQIFWVDESDVLTNLQSTTYDLDVTAGTPELKVTMVYRDPPGTTSSNLHRINDLDLRVTSPSGTVYHGNVGLTSANYSAPGGSPNGIDTVENVFVQSPQAGTWQVRVRAAAINQDSHVETGAVDADYALVVLGATPNTGPTPPNAPSNAAATATSTSSITVTWSDNSSDEDDFTLQRATSAGGPFGTIATIPANGTSYVDTGLTAGTQYFYRVRANNTVGSSGWSNVASATTNENPPTAPSNLAATATGQTTISLVWTDTSSNEDGFTVQRATSAGGPFATVATVAVNTTSYGDTGLVASTTYFYRVRADNTGGSSAWSNTASATTQSPPAATDYVADRGRLRKGSEIGSFQDTHANDGVYHTLIEQIYRTNRTRHNFDYYFDNLPAGTKTVFIKAYHTTSSDNEDWKVQYRNGGSWVNLIFITKTAENGQYQSAVIPSTASGTVRLRVRDIKRGKNRSAVDRCFVDHLFIRM